MATKKKENKNTKKGIAASVAFHLIVILCFLFFAAWRAPNPPIPEYGVELQFGLENTDEVKNVPKSIEAKVSESPEQQQSDEPVEATSAENPAEQTVDEGAQADAPSQIPVKTSISKAKKIDKTQDVQAKQAEQKKDTPSKEVQVTYKKVQQTDLPPDATPEKPVDSEHETGTLNTKALYSNRGEGVGLKLAGWTWDEIPKPHIPSDESGGRIEFEIKVDESGEIIGYRVLERSLSIGAERACRDAVSQLTFTKKKGAVVPNISIGKITFVVRAR